MGAWIEILRVGSRSYKIRVAPLVGAWIEMDWITGTSDCICMVAPLVGAWIEIDAVITVRKNIEESLPSWERGLKLSFLLAVH